MKPISRASGRSAVASAAYRAGESLTNERDGLTHDFTRRQGVEHCEIVVAQGAGAEWALDRSALWNAAEESESRKDARVAREFEIALPHELNAEQRLELTREFAQGLADRHGTAVDFAIHAPHGSSPDQVRGDGRNFHAHLMMTTRAVNSEGLGDKTAIERENKWLAANNLPLTQVQLVEIRQSWEQTANEHLARAGLEVQIDHRSHMERGLEIEPTEHMGVHATQMQRRGQEVSRSRLDSEAARRNAELIREKPEQVLSIITGEKSVFDRRDVARALHRYIDQPEHVSGGVCAGHGLKGSCGAGAGGSRREWGGFGARPLFDTGNGRDRARHGVLGRPDERGAGPWRRRDPCGGGAGVALLSFRRTAGGCPPYHRRGAARRRRWTGGSGQEHHAVRRARSMGARRVFAFLGRRCPGKPPRVSRNLPASPLAPWRRGITAGRPGAGNWVLAIFW